MQQPIEKVNPVVRVWHFYRDGFRAMTVGRYLWALILIKLFILFFVFKLFFFPTCLSVTTTTTVTARRL